MLFQRRGDFSKSQATQLSEMIILSLQALLLKRQLLQFAAKCVLWLRQYFDSYFASALIALAESTTSIKLTKERCADILAEFER